MKKQISGQALISGLTLFNTETVPSTQIGSIAYGPTGEKYRYAKVGASDLVLGNLLQGPINNTTNFDVLSCAAWSANDTTITVTLGGTAVTKDEFAGGTVTLGIAGGVLIGSYTIKSHPAQASTSGTVVLTLEEPLRIAGTSSQKATMRRNQYALVLQSAATPTSIPVGVALTAAAANTYTWIQTAGIVAVLSDNTTMVVGSDVAQSATAGAVTLANGALGRVGVAMSAKNSTGLIPIKLELD